MKSKKRMMRFLLPIILLIIIFVRPALLVYQQRNTLFGRGYSGQYENLRKVYLSSQYVNKINPGIIPDESLEAFIGGYLLKGGNPILVVHDHPPLGRYLIALSIFLFDNANTVPALLLFFSTVGILLISQLVFKNIYFSIIPTAIYVNEPLFLNKLSYTPLLEPIQLPFIIFSLFFFMKAVEEKKYIKYFIFASLMLGFVISIRFFIVGIFLLLTMLTYLLWKNHFNDRTKKFFIFLPISLIILIISYLKTIQEGYSIRQVIGVQKYILFYHKSALILPFSFLDLILFNRWHTWWGDRSISFDFQWIIAWPLFFILSVLSFLSAFLKKIKLHDTEAIILLWIFYYSLMLSVGYTSTRYFLPLLPFIYILGISFIRKLTKLYARGHFKR